MTDTNKIALGEYLFRRLQNTGIKSVFGVPGDFNLALLDYIDNVDDLKWVGNANELNAAYEADGYSRVNGFSALITTYGVGELSAVNGVAGSYAEHIGLIHIVGMPSISAVKNKLLLHHTLGDSRYYAFMHMSENISLQASVVENLESAPQLIDDLLYLAFTKKKPVYLGLPSNFVNELVPADRLETPLDFTLPPNDKDSEAEFIDNFVDLLSKSKKPVLLVDACANRHGVSEEVKKFAEITKIPAFITPMGKSTFDEDSPEFHGIYVGALTHPDTKEIVESSDCIVSMGSLLSDYNTGSFTYSYKTLNVTEFHSNYCKFKKATYENLQMKHTLGALNEKLASLTFNFDKVEKPKSIFAYKEAENCPGEVTITQDYLWKRLSLFLKEGDVLVTETGTSSFGVLETHLPKGVKTISQVLWGSIGFSLPAATGATFAVADQDVQKYKRVILFIGDGSLQLTVQAISDACKWNLPLYLFVLNNNGYTIEKLIHGLHADYNQIQPWKHLKMLDVFADKAANESIRVDSAKALDSLFKDEAFNTPDKIRVIELMLEEFDAPPSLVKQAAMSEKINSN
ncbi:indolepyruvate decarboxylase 6 [Martiniozyma asiatica (nom. inval.)]|nr:indolepyruvate decarboxylase 6 [Martiniozyma asiatica]